jgi:hypothetical protein
MLVFGLEDGAIYSLKFGTYLHAHVIRTYKINKNIFSSLRNLTAEILFASIS